MITIYLNGTNGTLCKYPKNIINLRCMVALTDAQIVSILEKADNNNTPISVMPHKRNNILRDNFISNHLSDKGYIIGTHFDKEYECKIGNRVFKYILKKPNT